MNSKPERARLLLGALALGGLVLAGCSSSPTASTKSYNGGNNGGRPHAPSPSGGSLSGGSLSGTPVSSSSTTTATPAPATTGPPATTAPVAVMPQGDSLGNMYIPGRPEYVAAQYTKYNGGYSWKWGPSGWLTLAKPYMAPSYYATLLAGSKTPSAQEEANHFYAPIEKYKETEYVQIDKSVLVDNGAATVDKGALTEVDQVNYQLGQETLAGVKEPIGPDITVYTVTYMMSKINGKWYVSGYASNGSG